MLHVSPVPPLDLAKATISLLSNQNIRKPIAPARAWVDPASVRCNICMTSRLHLPMDASTNPYGSKTVHMSCRQSVKLLEEYLKRNIAPFTAGNSVQTNEALVLVVKRLYELILEQTTEKTLEKFVGKFKLHEQFKPLANLALEAILGRYRGVVVKEKEDGSAEAASSAELQPM